ncbi:MAG: hypothetical protein M1839_007419 [Geoglossum umbratile]|nr:MAG: hypothetical protein M1839_007419 [Geoglossum umbratile]
MLVEYFLPTLLPFWALPPVLFLIYSLFLVIYRLYFHPLARFPGRRLAAITLWYEFYHDAIRRGKYTFEIKAMHEEFGIVACPSYGGGCWCANKGGLDAGPIVRINPHELHINDPDYYDYFFNLKLDKWGWFTRQFGNSKSTQSTPRHDIHRMRRGALAPFFTRAKVLQLENVIKDKTEMLCARLSGYRKVNNDKRHIGEELEPTCLGIAYHCLTTEVVTQYSWGRSYDCLDDPTFKEDWFFMLRGLAEVGHIGRQFGWFLPLMESLPVWLAGLINKNAKDSAVFRRGLVDQVQEVKKAPRDQFIGKSHPTIFHELDNSSLPECEKTSSRLSQEGLLVLFAGFETTANAMAVTTYHLLRNPNKLARVRAELEGVMRGRDGEVVGWVELEKLEYFSAVITEGLRMATGVSSRLPRLAPEQGLKFREWEIPPGVRLDHSFAPFALAKSRGQKGYESD